MKALVVLGLAVMLVPGVAADETTFVRAGSVWALFSLHHENETDLELFVGDIAGVAGGYHLLREDGRALASGHFSGTSARAFVSADVGPDPPFAVDTGMQTGPGGYMGMTVAAPAFDGFIAVWTAGEVGTTEFTVSGSGTSATLLREGTGTFYVSASDMDSDAHLMLHLAGSRVTYQEGGRWGFDVTGGFLGSVALGLEPAAGDRTTTLETPAGTQACPCRFDSLAQDETPPSGRWTIHRDALMVEASFPELILAGADFDLG